MNNEISMGKRIKDLLARKTLPTVLAGSMLFSGAFANEAQAYSLDEPSQSYEDFLNYDGIRVFINGRYVEFTESTGFPFVENGSTMIPLRAVSEAFGAYVNWNDYTRAASVCKYDLNVAVPVYSKDMKVRNLNSGKIDTVSATREAVVIDGITYIPLRSLFECFGLNVRWDSEKKIAHIETVSLDSLENIDFKEENVYSIKELINMENIKSFVFDGEKINKEYLSVLSESNQYAIIVKDDCAQIFSYQFLGNLNYYYGKMKLILDNSHYKTDERAILRNEREEDIEFFKELLLFNLQLNYTSSIKKKDEVDLSYVRLVKDNYDALLKEVVLIGDEIKSKTSDKKEQAILLCDYLNSNITYSSNMQFHGSYDALVNKEAVCDGYAFAFNFIADYLGLSCICVGGDYKNSSYAHAWNEVYLDGVWYIFDATTGNKMFSLNNSVYTYNIEDSEEKTKSYVEDKELFQLTYKF